MKKQRDSKGRFLKGHTFSEETKKKIGLSNKGIKRKPLSKLTLKRKSLASKKMWKNPEYRKNFKGMKGKKHSEETKEKIRKSKLKSKNPMWKGDNVGYFALHNWVKRHKQKPKFCEDCLKITNQLDISNISGKYKRDINDFKWLCRKCHIDFDKRKHLNIAITLFL